MIVAKMTPTADLIPYEGNPRDNDSAVAAVAKSIASYGFNSPIIVDKAGVVIAGHVRLRAAISSGIEQVPVVTLDISEEKAAEYRIADNKAAEFSDWMTADLVAELREVGDMSEYFHYIDVHALLNDTRNSSGSELPKQGDIDSASEQMGDRYKNRSEETHSKYSEVSCPSCLGKFFVDKDEAVRESGRRGA